MMDKSSFHLDVNQQIWHSLNLSLLSKRAKKYCQTARDFINDTEDLFTQPSSRKVAKFCDFSAEKQKIKNLRQPFVTDGHLNIRGFLRHTTYQTKNSNFFEKSSYDEETFRQTHSVTLLHTFENRMQNKNIPTSSKFQAHESSLKNYPKSSSKNIDDIANIATKVKRTASIIKQLKQLRQSKKKNLYRQNSYEEETKASNAKLKNFQSFAIKKQFFDPAKVQEGLGFKKRINENYFTPKSETQNTVEITENIQKMKRGYTPTLKKTLSPTHWRFSEKPRIQDFIIEKKLGGGKFGTVYRAFHHKTCSVFALKKIQKKTLQENMLIDQFIQQCKIQSLMRHQNIMELYGVFDDKENIFMILQLMQNGNLYGELRKKQKFDEKKAALIIKQISKGIVYMHDMGIAHRDLKPQNIVVSNQIYKICDFGWAALCQDRRKTCCGTFDYAAPEILQGDSYDLAVDYWGLGVIAYELMVGKPPFYHFSKKISKDNALNVQQKKIAFPSHLSSSAICFIESLLRKDPSKRLNFHQILGHPFLINVKTEDF